MQKEYNLTKSGQIRPIKQSKPTLKVTINVFNENCDGILYQYENIEESRIKDIFLKEVLKGNFCEVE